MSVALICFSLTGKCLKPSWCLLSIPQSSAANPVTKTSWKGLWAFQKGGFPCRSIFRRQGAQRRCSNLTALLFSPADLRRSWCIKISVWKSWRQSHVIFCIASNIWRIFIDKEARHICTSVEIQGCFQITDQLSCFLGLCKTFYKEADLVTRGPAN